MTQLLSTASYSDSESNINKINALTNESKPKTKINVTNVLKIYLGPSDIFHNINKEPIQPNLTFYLKSKSGNCWHQF